MLFSEFVEEIKAMNKEIENENAENKRQQEELRTLYKQKRFK